MTGVERLVTVRIVVGGNKAYVFRVVAHPTVAVTVLNIIWEGQIILLPVHDAADHFGQFCTSFQTGNY